MLFKARKVNNLNYHEFFHGMLGLNVYRVFMLYRVTQIIQFVFHSLFSNKLLMLQQIKADKYSQTQEGRKEEEKNTLGMGPVQERLPRHGDTLQTWGYSAGMRILTGQVSTDPHSYGGVLSQDSGPHLAQHSQLPDSPSLQPQDPCASEPGISPSCGPAHVIYDGPAFRLHAWRHYILQLRMGNGHLLTLLLPDSTRDAPECTP